MNKDKKAGGGHVVGFDTDKPTHLKPTPTRQEVGASASWKHTSTPNDNSIKNPSEANVRNDRGRTSK